MEVENLIRTSEFLVARKALGTLIDYESYDKSEREISARSRKNRSKSRIGDRHLSMVLDFF